MIRGLFYPDRCLLCGDLIPYGTRWTVCRRCSAVPYLPQGNRCPICSRMVSQPCMTCRSCRKHGNTIRGTAALRYEGAAAKAVQQLKYEGMRSLADAMAAANKTNANWKILGGRKKLERKTVTAPLSAAAICAYAGKYRDEVMSTLDHYDYSTIALSEFYPATLAYELFKVNGNKTGSQRK